MLTAYLLSRTDGPQENLSNVEVEEIFGKLSGPGTKMITFQKFCDYVQDETFNSIYHPDFDLVRQDMSLPLSWYVQLLYDF